MNTTTLACKDERRRQLVRDQANTDRGLNGIDFVEVIEGTGQRELCVHFFGGVPDDLRVANVRIEGGERFRNIRVVNIEPHLSSDSDHADCLRVLLDRSGDFSCYRLCLYDLDKDGDTSNRLLSGFDRRYACSTFSFKVDCPSDLDCKVEAACFPVPKAAPEINYLAKDYASFRQLLLDRLALIVPEWRERHVPDIGIALVELLAYAGDHLSYYQDAVATEAYLDTARERISVRRHARLVDYFVHEGCNARSWMFQECAQDCDLDAREIYFITGCSQLAELGPTRVIAQQDLDTLSIPAGRYEVFEPMVKDADELLYFYAEHNQIRFYTWGDADCCLPAWATSATLVDKWVELPPPQNQPVDQHKNDEDHHPEQQGGKEGEYRNKRRKDHEHEAVKPPARHRALRHLKVDDILIFEEVLGPETGNKADADKSHRWAVRLTRVTPTKDPLTRTPIVEIEWAIEDALPFPLCLSAMLPAPECELREDISVARGNVILVDHGKTVCEGIDGVVPTNSTIGECVCEGSVVDYTDVPGKFRPKLRRVPLTFSQGVSFRSPASGRLAQDPGKALPATKLLGVPEQSNDGTNWCDRTAEPWKPGWRWHPKRDLLDSRADDRNFVVEIDNEGVAHIRFGDDECGKMPEAGMAFTARYRVGNGTAGNVGADTIKYLVTRNLVDGLDVSPRNPLAARGGTQAEPIAEAKLYAPGAFRKSIERAITADDYASIAARNAKVQRAAAKLRWTGSWYGAQVAIDAVGTETLSGKLRNDSQRTLHRYRRIGHDLWIKGARYVPLLVEFEICVTRHYLRGDVESALRDVFSDRVLGDGRRGFFDPDSLTFGQGVYLSSLVAAAQALDGVSSVNVTKLQRLFENPNDEIANGVLPLAGNEIAQLANDPNFPERGRLIFKLNGGR